MSFEQYEKLKLLGKSHIGAVYECLDSKHRHTVAALEVTSQVGETTSWDEAWGEILKYYRRFNHEYIVPVRDTVKDQRLIIMDLMTGSMRSELASRERIAPDVVRRCLRRCLEALSKVHSEELIHGDIRPDQLLFNGDGRFRLSFSVGLKPGGVVIRRDNYNQYLAPELLNPAAGPVGPQVDLYALGVTAYELLVGTAPLTQLVPGVGPNAPEPQKQWLKWQAELNSPLPPLREVFKNVPRDLAEVVDGLVQKKTSARFQTAKEALDRLETGSVDDDVLIPLADLQSSSRPPAGSGPSNQQIQGDRPRGYDQYSPGDTMPPPGASRIDDSPPPEPPRRYAEQVRGEEPVIPSPQKPPKQHAGSKKPPSRLLLGGGIAALIVLVGLGIYTLFPTTPKKQVSKERTAIDPIAKAAPMSTLLKISGTIDPPRSRLLINGSLVEVTGGRWETRIPSPARRIEVFASHEGFATLQRYFTALELEKTNSLALDPYVDVAPADVAVSLEGKDLPVAQGRVRIQIPEGQERRVTLTRGETKKDFTLTRESLAKQKYRLELPDSNSSPPTPAPAPKEYVVPDGLEAVAGSGKGKATLLPVRVKAKKLPSSSGTAEFVLVEPGTFKFGIKEPKRMGDAQARYEKVIRPFYIAAFETTNAQFSEFEAKQGDPDSSPTAAETKPADGAKPAVSKSLEQMQAYGKWISPGGRLPTEVEWEYAARFDQDGESPLPTASAATANCYFAVDNLLPSDGTLLAVDALPESRTSLGLFHLLGNAAEACNTPFSHGFQLSKVQPTSLVARGGSYLEGQESLNVFVRDPIPPTGDPFVGFRVVVECDGGPPAATGATATTPSLIGE